jgi:large repetitive protein
MKLLLPFFFFISFFCNSQTLYWVGGTGNFSDPSHWSFTSGGKSANVVPGQSNSLVYDDNSASGDFQVSLTDVKNVQSFQFNNKIIRVKFTIEEAAQLTLHASLYIDEAVVFEHKGKLIFESDKSTFEKIGFAANVLKGNLIFKKGNWDLRSIYVDDNHSVEFIAGHYKLHNSRINCGDFSLMSSAHMDCKNGKIVVANKFYVDPLSSFQSENLILKTNTSDVAKFQVPSNYNFGSNAKILNSMAPPCGATLTSSGISCFQVCDGFLVLTIDVACGPTPLSLIWSNPDASCTTPTLTTVPGPGTYTISNMCACAQFYDVLVFDNSSNLLTVSNSTNVAGTSAINFVPIAFVQPSCFGLCNGSITGNLSGSSAPYTVTVNGGANGVYPVNSGASTYTGLCAGINTFVVVDSKNCSRTVTVNLNQPAQVQPNPVTASITCFGACNGSLVVAPTGGSGSTYTVVFNPGGTFTVASGSSVASTGLCPGAISATVTDVNGCTAVTSTAITQPTQLIVTPTQTDVTCFGLCNATASVNVTGGISPYTFTWSSSGSSTNVANGLCAGIQTVTIQNNGGLCTNTQTFNIIQPSSITITPSSTNNICPGVCAGVASVVASGGGGGITFTWTPPAPGTSSVGATISNLCAGAYTVLAQDVNTCTNSAVVTITSPPAYTVTTSSQTLSCFGSCTGAATINVSGSNGPPYNFVSSPATNSIVSGGTLTASNLCAGNYTVTISDGSCTATPVVISIAQPSSITLNPSTTSITCNGLCNGAISVNPSGGVAPYTYTLLTPTAGTVTGSPPFTGLCAGIYTVIIQDQVPCSQSFTVSVAQPNPLLLSIAGTSVSCFGSCNGVLTGSVGGGTPGYTLSWNTGTSTVNGGILSGVCANQIYTLSVTDGNSCTSTQTASVNQPSSGISGTITPTQPLCSTSCNGALNALISGGTPNYTLSWSNGGTGSSITNLCAGNYTLTVTDANGCQQPFPIALTAPPSITLNVTTTPPTCAGSASGSATVVAVGGTAPYVFQLGALTNTTGVFSGLTAGNYIINTTDANGCIQSVNFSIANPPALSGAITGLQSSCNACTGAATVTASGGVPGYTVSWTNSVNVAVGTGSTISNLCPGNHTATITDANGCVTTVTAGVVQTVSVTVVTGGTGIQCFGACTGSAVANPSGGTPPYTYTWTPSAQNTQTATGLCAGAYTVLVSDVLGCSNTGSITLVNPALINVTATQTNISCFGLTTGAISASVTGGTGVLSFLWLPGNFTTTSVSNLAAGVYTLTVTDQNNCSSTSTYTITQNSNIVATFTTTQPTGCNVTNGSICVSATGGAGSFTYSWTPGATTGSCITNIGAGAYSVLIQDQAGCTQTVSSNLTNPAGPSITVATQSVLCNGGNTGSATVTVTSGNAPYGYTWTPTVGFVNLGNTSTALSLTSGTYVIAVEDGITQCITTQTINISEAPAYTVAGTIANPSCFGTCNGSITLTTSGATPGYTYNWTGSGTVTGQGTQTVTGLCNGTYTVNINDQNNCVRTQSFAVVQPAQLAVTNTVTNVQCFSLCNGSIVANANGGTAPLNFSWTPVGAFTGSTTATILNLCPAIYTLTITDGNNCQAVNVYTVTEPPVLTSNLGFINVACSNSCNASATLTAGGGTPNYSYSWSGSVVTSSVITGLCPGSYSGTVTDSNGCPSTQSFTVTAPLPFTATLTPFSPLCNAACSGSIATVLAGAQGTVSYNWAPTGAGSDPNNLCAGNYTLTAIDAAGCQLSSVATLTNPPAILANVTTTNPSCSAICNGSAISSPANAVGTVTYSWIPTGPPTFTTQSISALCGGSYTLLIQDGNGCSAVQAFTLTNPQPLNLNVTSAPATCGASNGSISVLPTGGTPTYTFAWSPSVATGSTASGLGAGVYTVTVNDANNCTNSITIPLSNSNGPASAPVTSSSITCFGLCNATASIDVNTIIGGTPGYSIAWISPPSSTTVNPQTNLCAGSYSAQVTDANNCILFSGVTITQPSSVSINPTVGLPTCNGICNGTVGLNTIGGTPNYSFNWSPAAANSETIANVCAGTVTVVITDANSCAFTHTVNVPATQNILASISTSSNQCFSSCSATAAVNITGSPGNPINPTNINWSNGQVGFTANSLCAGIYSVVITDQAGCNNTFTTSILAPSQITAVSTVTLPGCNMCNGISVVTANGGSGPYTYSWTSGSSSQTASNLCAGLYQVIITDNNLCTYVQNVPVSNSTGITGETFTVVNESCNNTCDGSASVTAVGGTAPITYTWLTLPATTNSVVNNLCEGDYFVQMMDAQGCIRTSSVTIGSAPGLTISPFITPPDCGATNGTISVIAAGGNGIYTYSWSPSTSTSSVLSNVGPGNYSVTVTSNGCSNTQIVTISNFNSPTLTYTQSNIACFNSCTGSVVAVASPTDVTYQWSTGASTTGTLTGACAGLVTLTVTSQNNGCISVQNFTLSENSPLQLSTSNVHDVLCFGDCNGDITLIPSGGVLPYTFTWSPSGTSNPQTSLCVGSYTGIVTDAMGCTVQAVTSIVGPASPLSLTTNTVINSSCSSVADGSIAIDVNGGTPVYTFSWTGNPTFTANTQNLNGILAGTYTLDVTDQNNCPSTLTVEVVPTITIVANAGQDSTFCTNSSIVLNGGNSLGATGGYLWIELPSTATIANTSTVTVTPATGSSTFVLQAISSVSNCVSFDTIVVNSLPLPDVNAGPSFTIPVYSSVTIGGNPTSLSGISFSWTPAFTLDDGTVPNPVASNTINTVYTITVVDANGCRASDTVRVDIYPEIKIPNGFSPNGDSRNDTWIIDNINQFPEVVVEVYNRWGELLFMSRGYNVPFDGRYGGKPLPVGTYYYVINLNHPAYTKPYTGPLTIFR